MAKKKTPNKPTWEEWYMFCKSRNFEHVAITAWDYYEAGDWHDSNGKPVLNWKQKLIAVWFKKDGKTTAKATNTNKPKSHLEQLQERYFGGDVESNRPDTLDIEFETL